MVREDEIIPKLISDIEAEVGSGVDVRTSGHDAVDNDVDPPEVIIDWSASRLPLVNGHNSHGGATTDQNGNKTGHEHHSYWEFRADCLVRYYDEVKRDKVTHDVQMAFLPYETSPEQFHRDTRLWEVGSAESRPMLAVEPDWYQTGVLTTFEYLKRTSEDADVLDTVNVDTVDNDDDTVETTSELIIN